MHRDDVTFGEERIEVGKGLRAFDAGARRVVEQDPHTVGAADFGDLGADIADAHDAEREGVEPQAMALSQHGQHGRDILLDGP